MPTKNFFCTFTMFNIAQNLSEQSKVIVFVMVWFECFLLEREISTGAWSKLHLTITPPYIYGTHRHNVAKWTLLLSKIPPNINGTSQKKHFSKMVVCQCCTHKVLLLCLRYCHTLHLLRVILFFTSPPCL